MNAGVLYIYYVLFCGDSLEPQEVYRMDFQFLPGVREKQGISNWMFKFFMHGRFSDPYL